MQTNATSSRDSETQRHSYVLYWYRRSDPRCSWYIRAIKPDRSFYGEITVFNDGGGNQLNVSGNISEEDYARLVVLVGEFERHLTKDWPDPPWDGVLAQGPVNDPCIIFRYRGGAHKSAEDEQRFVELVNLMAPYLRQLGEST